MKPGRTANPSAEYFLMSTRLYLLCGLSFAGKSTLAKQLAAPLDAVIVECDQYIAAVRPNQLSKMDEWRAIQNLARARVRELLQSGKSVIYDDLMVKPDTRMAVTELAGQCGAKTVTIYLNTPVAVTRQRQQDKSPTPEQQSEWEAHTQLLLSQLAPPSRNEAVWVEPGYTLDTVLADIARRC